MYVKKKLKYKWLSEPELAEYSKTCLLCYTDDTEIF